MLSKCRCCGRVFDYVRKKSNKLTCSVECAKVKAELVLNRRTVCSVCGGAKKSEYAFTCSARCKEIRRIEKLKNKQYNLCHYTAEDMEGYLFMLDILHRKGYEKANSWEEKWTYVTEGYPNIKWLDRVARGTLLPRKTRSRKEQPRHEDGVQQEAQEASASAHPIEELQAGTDNRTPSAKETVGR